MAGRIKIPFFFFHGLPSLIKNPQSGQVINGVPAVINKSTLVTIVAARRQSVNPTLFNLRTRIIKSEKEVERSPEEPSKTGRF